MDDATRTLVDQMSVNDLRLLIRHKNLGQGAWVGTAHRDDLVKYLVELDRPDLAELVRGFVAGDRDRLPRPTKAQRTAAIAAGLPATAGEPAQAVLFRAADPVPKIPGIAPVPKIPAPVAPVQPARRVPTAELHEGDLLTPDQVRAILQVSRNTFYRLVESGTLPVVKLSPKCLRVRRVDLEVFVASRMSGKA